MAIPSLDLTVRPPRSPRVRLGGYVILPRMLDKGRAVLNGKNGEYKYNCPMDQHFVNFVGVDPEGIRSQLQAGKGDQEVLQWIEGACKIKRQPHEIAAWSLYHEGRGPTDVETRQFFTEQIQKYGPAREDIVGWFDLLDLDDYVSFGGRA